MSKFITIVLALGLALVGVIGVTSASATEEECYDTSAVVIDCPVPPFDQCPDQSDDQPVGTECPVITPPDPLIETTHDVTYNCGDDFQTVHVVRTTTTYDPESGPIAWDILDVVIDEFDLIEPHDIKSCRTSTTAPALPNTGG